MAKRFGAFIKEARGDSKKKAVGDDQVAAMTKTFTRQLNDYVTKMKGFTAKGDHASAKIWATHAERAYNNLKAIKGN